MAVIWSSLPLFHTDGILMCAVSPLHAYYISCGIADLQQQQCCIFKIHLDQTQILPHLSFPFVQFKISVYGRKQTYTRVLQCCHASVGLAQARPNEIAWTPKIIIDNSLCIHVLTTTVCVHWSCSMSIHWHCRVLFSTILFATHFFTLIHLLISKNGICTVYNTRASKFLLPLLQTCSKQKIMICGYTGGRGQAVFSCVHMHLLMTYFD